MNLSWENDLKSCRLCPRRCGADRLGNERGFCGQGATLRAAKACLHLWEEPCLTGEMGAGCVFFTGCNLGCAFCQNGQIAAGDVGREITDQRLADIFLELQDKGAACIDLVTPTPYAHAIYEAVLLARDRGLRLPVVYNCGGYESVEVIKRLAPVVDVWMPDFKYMDAKLAAELSGAGDYAPKAMAALEEMTRQQSKPVFDMKGILQKGVLVRHLVLPGHLMNTRKVLRYLKETYGDSILVSVMSQYTPVRAVPGYPELSRRLTPREYDKVKDYMAVLGMDKGYVQEGDVAEESFIPSFDLEGLCVTGDVSFDTFI